MAINYDPAAHGGAAFGDQDYEHLKSQGHSDSEINNYIGSLGTTSVSNKYKDRGGHQENDDSWKHYDDSWDGFIASAAPTQAQRDAQAKADAHTAKQAQKKAEKEAAARAKEAAEKAAAEAKFKAEQDTIKGLTANKKGPGGGIDYDPSKLGGAAFGNQDYDHLKGKGHSDEEINSYLSTLDNTQVSNKYKERGGFTPNTQSSTGGWQDSYNKDGYLQGLFDKAKADNPNAGTSNMKNTFNDVTANGLLSYDSTGAMWQDGNALHAAGVKEGDMLFDKDSFKDINGRQITGRVGKVTQTAGGGYHYTPEWATNENTTDGGLDIETFSGRGSRDQFSHLSDDQYYEINNQYSDTWAKNRDQAQADIDEYRKDQGYKAPTAPQGPTGGSVRPEDVKPITANQDPASSGVSVDTGSTNQNFTSNLFSGFSNQSSGGYKGIDINDLQSSYAKLGFNFDPNRFNTQGQ